ncbi:hypothetical protein OG429_09130 [Streptomyces sp. NBC_00190]|uniref:hypothetical protein n=1 Tax=unclassified Streptomyces TaxID=2593676 RepID=UPI002E2D74F2|nr:hypothetical protein [Streptomyces sp. NBC_00190]WSZ39492.1 hypothetical protein OG239_12130 [Streptomyces sp. NBC_00868]
MWDLRRDAERGRAAVAILLRRDPDVAVRMLFRSGPEAWTAFDKDVRRDRSRLGGALPSNRIEARLCDPDGRIRESALSAWRRPPAHLVVIRCADWVPAVRNRARRVLGRIVARDPVSTLVTLAPLILRLGRREHGAWAVEQLEAAVSGRYSLLAAWWRPGRASTTWSLNSLTSEQRDSILNLLCLRADLPARRFAARLTSEAGRTGVRELAARARDERDPVTSRIWVDAALAAMAADGPDGAAIDDLLAGHFPPVRAGGVTALRRAGRAAEAVDHLADRSGTVRACARWLVRQGGDDPYAVTRALLEDPARVTPNAVTGFAECAGPADAPLLRALLEHPAGAVRAAAVGGLRLMDATDHDLLRPLLDDPSPAVAREVSLSLRSEAGRLPADWLLARTAPEQPLHTRRAAYRLLYAQGGVAWLRAAVELQAVTDPGLRHLAAQHIQGLWPTYGPMRLPAGDPEVGALLDRCTGLASGYAIRWMRSQLAIPRAECGMSGY